MINFNANSIKDILNSKEYDFLKTNENLQENIILIGLGGSLAYGTNNEDMDLVQDINEKVVYSAI